MTHSSRKYPWEEWMNGDDHVIHKGSDYTCSTGQMRNYVYRKAYDNGLKVRINTLADADGLSFTFLTKDGWPLKTEPVDPNSLPYDVPDGRDPVAEIDDRSWISDEAIARLNQE